MKLGDAIKKAIDTRDYDLAGKLSDFMRAKGLNYNQTVEVVTHAMACRGRPGKYAARWEELMYAADTLT